ncbi:hypothetical protein, partial [Pseudoalteromonas sp.]|uniref:hypothetical protein n=1 Tax=Pseudoalteromonas sp. TaxID=53249 RepID=UPI002622E5BC
KTNPQKAGEGWGGATKNKSYDTVSYYRKQSNTSRVHQDPARIQALTCAVLTSMNSIQLR